MKVRDVINRLEKVGWTLVRTSGSHRHYRHPNKPAIVTIAGKPGSDIPIGTLKSIFDKQAGADQSARGKMRNLIIRRSNLVWNRVPKSMPS